MEPIRTWRFSDAPTIYKSLFNGIKNAKTLTHVPVDMVGLDAIGISEISFDEMDSSFVTGIAHDHWVVKMAFESGYVYASWRNK